MSLKYLRTEAAENVSFTKRLFRLHFVKGVKFRREFGNIVPNDFYLKIWQIKKKIFLQI